MGKNNSDKPVEGGSIGESTVDSSLAAEEVAEPVKIRRWTRLRWISLFTIVALAIIFVAIYFLSRALDDAWLYGYFGAFVISLMASAVVIIPVPSLPVIYVLGAILNPFIVGLMVGLAEPIGELTSYVAGYSGRNSLQNRRFYSRLQDWMRRRGSLVLFGLSALPNPLPLTKVTGVAAGALRYPVWKFLLVMFLGKTVKGMIVALAGYWTLRLVLELVIR